MSQPSLIIPSHIFQPFSVKRESIIHELYIPNSIIFISSRTFSGLLPRQELLKSREEEQKEQRNGQPLLVSMVAYLTSLTGKGA